MDLQVAYKLTVYCECVCAECVTCHSGNETERERIWNYIIYALLKVNIHCDYFSLTTRLGRGSERSENSHAKIHLSRGGDRAQRGGCQGCCCPKRKSTTYTTIFTAQKLKLATEVERERDRRDRGGSLGHGLPRMLSRVGEAEGFQLAVTVIAIVGSYVFIINS